MKAQKLCAGASTIENKKVLKLSNTKAAPAKVAFDTVRLK